MKPDPSPPPPWTPPQSDGGYPPSYPPWYPAPPARRVPVGLIVALVAAALLLFGGLIAAAVWFVSTYEREQVELVSDAMAQLAEGRPLDDEDVCAEPDETVAALMRDADAWRVTDYEVLGIADDNPITPTSLWYVDVRVNGELWIVETWDHDAGHMAGICAVRRR